MAKGQFGHRSRRFQQAQRAILKSLAYQFRDRRVRKREFHNLWIIRINAACRQEGMPYSRFIKGLTAAKVEINRKMIADLAVHSPEGFRKLVELAKTKIG